MFTVYIVAVHVAGLALAVAGVIRAGDRPQALVDRDAFQCGYCTAGQIMSAVKLLEEGHAGDDTEIAEFMSGNICRCAAYPNIRGAIRAVRDVCRKDADATR